MLADSSQRNKRGCRPRPLTTRSAEGDSGGHACRAAAGHQHVDLALSHVHAVPWEYGRRRLPIFRSGTGRNDDLTPGTAGAAKPSVQRHQRTIERLGQRHVPGVVAGEMAPQRPTPGRRTARTGTVRFRDATDPRMRCWPQAVKLPRLVPTDAKRCTPRPTPAPERPENPRRLQTPPIPRGAPSRQGPRPVRTNRRRSSRPVPVTRPQDKRWENTGARRLFAIANALQPHAEGGTGCNPFQLATEEFLHGLALQCRARCEFVTHVPGDASDGDLYRHERTMPSIAAFCKHCPPPGSGSSAADPDGPGRRSETLKRRSRPGSCATGAAGPLRPPPARFRREEARTASLRPGSIHRRE